MFSFVNREPSILTALTGEIRLNTTFLEGRLGLIHKKPSYLPTGTLPSPRSASVWRLDNSSGSLWSTSRPTLCTRWSLMGNPAEPCWAVTRGRSWLGHRPLCSSTVSRTVLMPYLPERSVQARIGIVGNNKGRWYCSSHNSRIGFGTGGHPDDSNTCGNAASNEKSDNGPRHIKAFGYILEQ